MPARAGRSRALPLAPFLLLTLLFVAGPRSAHAAPPALSFTSDHLWFETGRFPQGLVTADFNRDGIADLASVDSLDDGVSVLLGAPGGGFKPRVSYGAGRGPVALVAFDADGDGITDLAVANQDAGTVSLLRGTGQGSFGSAVDFPAGGSPTLLLAQDLTGDGVPDLVVATGLENGAVWLLRGQGGTGFGAPEPLLTGVAPVAVAMADLRAHGRRAIAVATAHGNVSVLTPGPHDRYQVATQIALPGCPRSMTAADFDGDGVTDLLVAGCSTLLPDTTGAGTMFLLRGKANGDYVRGPEIPTDFIASSLAVADVDQDGRPDIVGTDRAHGRVAVFRGDRTGGFQPGHAYRTGVGADSPVIGDWNCDGRPDLAVLDPRGLAVAFLPGNGDGTFGHGMSVDTPDGIAGLWLGDLDGDGRADLVLTDLFTERLSVRRGDGHGGFAAESDASSYLLPGDPTLVAGAVLRAGGPVDLVLAQAVHNGFIAFGRNQGNGSFGFAADDTVMTGGRPTALAVGDVNGDGAPDVLVGNESPDVIDVFLGDGTGRVRLAAMFGSGGGRPVSLGLGDVDGDGHSDLVVTNELTQTIVLFHGSGTGDFVPVQTILAGARPLAATLAHLDSDAHLDLVTAQADLYPSRGHVIVYRGDGQGGFVPFDAAMVGRVGYEPSALAAVDLDGDGTLDIAVANAGGATVTLLPGRRQGRYGFGAPLTLGVASGSGELAVADVDGDGRPDLAVAGLDAVGVSLLLNRTGDVPVTLASPAVDVEPGQCPNRLNVDGGGLVRAALLGGALIAGAGSTPLDPAAVLPDSVTLEGVPAMRVAPSLRDVGGATDACGAACQCPGGPPDGVKDAIFTFDARAVAASLGPVHDGDTRVLHFEVRLPGGQRFEAQDCIEIAAHGRPSAASPRDETAVTQVTGPNPLARGGTMTFAYRVPAGGADVRIGVYSASGRRVAGLVHAFEAEGAHSAAWNGHDDAGRSAEPGVYFLQATVGGVRHAARVVILP